MVGPPLGLTQTEGDSAYHAQASSSAEGKLSSGGFERALIPIRSAQECTPGRCEPLTQCSSSSITAGVDNPTSALWVSLVTPGEDKKRPRGDSVSSAGDLRCR